VNPTFTLKDVITLGVILASIFGSWYTLRERVIRLEVKVEPIYDQFINSIERVKIKSKSAKAGE